MKHLVHELRYVLMRVVALHLLHRLSFEVMMMLEFYVKFYLLVGRGGLKVDDKIVKFKQIIYYSTNNNEFILSMIENQERSAHLRKTGASGSGINTFNICKHSRTYLNKLGSIVHCMIS